ncbi:hypothetical protein QJS04_geneDACA003269 [Acorus gramineus]|uniref:Uncharacterized protein n=1 Tax=Acorus gramineus TaxID=55184 RepID=A0AAV9BXK1_ACOGR|nr:hypothetical protein QJS04_geneDACA003269 [Acorus gramineus]
MPRRETSLWIRKSSFHNRSTTIGRTSTTIRPPPLWISSPDCPLPPFDRGLSGSPLLEIGALLDEARSTLTGTTPPWRRIHREQDRHRHVDLSVAILSNPRSTQITPPNHGFLSRETTYHHHHLLPLLSFVCITPTDV